MDWSKVQEHLVGKTITDVVLMNPSQADQEFGWYNRPIIILLDDGTTLIPMSDDEGNSAGSIATNIEDIEVIPSVGF